jgi:nitroreductase
MSVKERTMMLKDLILKNRSYRRFDETSAIDVKTLRELVDLARLSPSGANLQPLKYLLVNDTGDCARVFPHLAWAGYLTDWPGPAEGERPTAYIVILHDTGIKMAAGCDHCIAAQSILLGAAERNLGGCIIGSVQRDGLREALRIAEPYEIKLVIALGVPIERVVLETATPDGGIEYWRDEEGVHHVPKRPLNEIIVAREGRDDGGGE